MKGAIYITFAFFVFSVEVASADESEVRAFRNAHNSFFHLLDPGASLFEGGYRLQPSNKEDGSSGEFDLSEFFGKVEFPIVLSSNAFVPFELEYSARIYDFEKGASLSGGSETLHQLAFTFGVGQFLTPDFLLVARGEFGVYSDFDEIGTDDFKIFGDGLLVYQVNPGTQLVLGVVVSEDFESAEVFPVAGFRLMSTNGRFHASLTAPLDLELSYNILPKLRGYAGAWVFGAEYNTNINNTELDIRVHDRRFGVGFQYWLTEKFNFSVEGGVSSQSEFQLKTNPAGPSAGDLDSAGYAEIRFGLNL